MKRIYHILNLEDNPLDAELIVHEIKTTGIQFTFSRVETRDDFTRELDEHRPDMVLSDYKLPSFDGMSALAIVREGYSEIPFIFITGSLGEEVAIEALKNGATDYVMKDRLSKLPNAVIRALQEREERDTRLKAEEALRVKDRALESSINAVALSGLDGKLTYVNPAFLKMWGYRDREEVEGRSAVDFWASHDEAVRVMAALQKTGQWSGEMKAVNKDGGEFDVELAACIILGVDGGPTGLFAAFQDITERKQAAHDLEASETRYRRLFESAKDGILILDAMTGRIVDVNPFLTEMTGYSHGEFLDKHLWDIGPFKDVQSSKLSFDELQTRKYIRYENLPLKTNDGREIHVEFVSNMYKVDNTEVIQCNIRDITERKRAEVEAALNTERVEMLLRLNQMTDASLQEITDFALEEAVRLTQSTIGYLAFLSEDESVLTMYSWSKAAMDECAIIEKPIVYSVATTGLWGEAVRQRRSVITNDYAAANPLKKGCPQGHVLVKRHMNVPVFDGLRIVLVAGVGNKEGEYVQNDARQLTLIMEGVWRLLERKRTETALRESEIFARSTIDGLSAHIAIVDESGVILAVNRSWREFAEKNPPVRGNVSEGANYLAVCDTAPSDAPEAAKFAEAIRSILHGGVENFEMEYACHSPDEQRWFVGRVTRFPDSAVPRVVVAHENITERKQAEKALKKSEQRYAQVAAQSLTCTWETDMRGIFTFISTLVEEITGYRPDELVGKMHFYDLAPAEDRDAVMNTVLTVIQNRQQLSSFENRVLTKDGRVIWADSQAMPIFGEQGELIGIRGADTEITERKRVEEELQRQLKELQRWHAVTVDREDRVIELKKEVNDLLKEAGRPGKYGGS